MRTCYGTTLNRRKQQKRSSTPGKTMSTQHRLRLKKATHVSDGKKTPLDEHAEQLSEYNPDDYIVNESLIGADRFSHKEVRCLRGSDDVVSSTLTNHLTKTNIRNERHILQLLETYANGSCCYAWISKSLPSDMDLPIPVTAPCEVVQAFFIGEDLPLFVLTLYDGKNASEEDVQDYADKTVKHLRHRLLDYCHVDLLILPCVLQNTPDVHSLDKEICKHRDELGMLFDGEMILSKKSLDAIKAAAVAASRCSAVPCLLKSVETEEQACTDGWYVQMDSDCACFFSCILEEFDKGDFLITYPPSVEFKVRAAVLEAAKRLSYCNHVHVATDDNTLTICIEKLMEHTESTSGLYLNLTVAKETDTESSYIVYLDAEEETTETVKPNAKELLTQPEIVLEEINDPIARRIKEQFVLQVDPQELICCLPFGFLTKHEENKVVAKQKKYGRADAAKMLLVLISKQNNWIEKLQKGLRNSQLRRDSIADQLDQPDQFLDDSGTAFTGVSQLGAATDREYNAAYQEPTVCNELPQPGVMRSDDPVQDTAISQSVHVTMNQAETQSRQTDLVTRMSRHSSVDEQILPNPEEISSTLNDDQQSWHCDGTNEQANDNCSQHVPIVLKHGLHQTQPTLSIVEAVKHACEQQVITDHLPKCAHDELGLVLRTLVNRCFWTAVSRVLNQGVSDVLRSWAVTEAAATANETDFEFHIFPHCQYSDSDSVLTRLVCKGMWKTISLVLPLCVNKSLRKWVLTEATSASEKDSAEYILPCYSKDEVNSVLTDLAERGMWREASSILKWRSSDDHIRLVVTLAAGKANMQNFIKYVVPYCPDNQRDFVLAHMVERGHWHVAGALVEEKHTCPETQVNVIATGKARIRHFLHIFSPEEQKIQILVECVFRGYWRAVLAILRQGVSEAVKNWTVSFAVRRCKLEQVLLEFLGFITIDHFPQMIATLLSRNRMKLAFRLLEILPGESTVSPKESPMNKRVKRHSKFEERIQMLQKELKCFRSQLNNVIACIIEATAEYREHGKVSALSEIGFADESDVRSSHSSENKEKLVNYLMQIYSSESLDRCIVALLAFAPSMPYLQRASLEQLLKANDLKLLSLLSGRDMPEETRRWLFTTALQHEYWAIVKQFGDHTLYDDLRIMAINKAVTCKRWTVALCLADHGLTTPELMRLHERLAMYAGWGTVLKLFDRGGNIKNIISLLQQSVRQTWQNRKNVALQNRVENLITLGQMLNEMSAQREQISNKCNWRVDLYRLQTSTFQNESNVYRVLQKAIRNGAWHVVVHLLRLGIHAPARDSLFLYMMKHERWSVCRALLELGISTELCLQNLETMIAKKQWLLAARMMEYDIDDARRKEVMKTALATREGSVVWHCINTLQERLSVEEREVLFHEALVSKTWQALKALVMEKDETGQKHRDKAMVEAVAHNQWDMVDHCMRQNADICHVDQAHSSILLAAKLRDWDKVQHFVERGLDPVVQNAQGVSLLHMAICDQAWTTVKVLIKHNGNTIHQPDNHGLTPLNMLIDACQGELLEYALDWCPDLQKGVNREGETTLHAVCLSGCWRAVYYLVARGVDRLAVTKHGHSALMYAVQNKDNPQQIVAECIQQGFSTHQPRLNYLFKVKMSPFEYAVLKDMPIVAQMLYESGACSYHDLFGMCERLSAASKGYCIEFTKKVAKTPRRLESTCRLVISHALNVRKRHKAVKRLPLSAALREYVMFSDLTNPQYGFDTSWWNDV